MFDPKPFEKENLIKDSIKGLISSVREGDNIQYHENGFIVTLYPQRNPYYEIRLSLDGQKPCVTRCHKYKEGLSKEVI